jgi:two-component system KDP operon response regulator KdpE
VAPQERHTRVTIELADPGAPISGATAVMPMQRICNVGAPRPAALPGHHSAPTAHQRPSVRDTVAPDVHTQLPSYQEAHVSTQPLVLVADDEPRITKLVAIALAEEGFRVVTANSGEQALEKAEEIRPDIILLDIVMPDLDGIEVMRQLRERRPVPVILLTAKGSTADKAKGLDLGADDYIAKPFHPDELAARVRAVIRRSGGAEPGAGVLRFDDVEIDLERRMVTRGGELVQLSRTEWLLLQHLAANAGKVVLHTELLTKVWGPEYRDDLQDLRVWVSRVRRKLGAAPGEPGRIRTFQGIGYLLDVDPASHPDSGGGDDVGVAQEPALIG